MEKVGRRKLALLFYLPLQDQGEEESPLISALLELNIYPAADSTVCALGDSPFKLDCHFLKPAPQIMLHLLSPRPLQLTRLSVLPSRGWLAKVF